MNDEIGIKFSNKVTGSKELQEYEKRLQNIYSLISSIEKGRKEFKNLKTDLKDIQTGSQDATKDVNKMAKEFDIAFGLKSMSGYLRNVTNFFKSLTNMTQKSANYVENINLLDVAYLNVSEDAEESSKRIEGFVDKMADIYSLDENDLTRKFGVFKQLANAMKLPTETGEKLSELMVKMTNDISSLYNLDLNRASNALQSALAGQVRPIRGATGADITEKTLQQTVSALGLDRTINQLSYVEKRLIMVISLTDQLKKSQGDWANTLNDSVANQLRVLNEQWNRLSRTVGNIFIPLLQKVLPYLNAILMVITEIVSLFASLVGFKLPEFDYSNLTGIDDATLDLVDNMEQAGQSVDKLKDKLKGLRGFDKLNVISTPSNSGSTGVGSGVDPKILNAFNSAFSSYNDKMDEMKNKARDVRDSIMEWLGFTKEIDKETGAVSFKFEKITSGTVLGALAVGGTIYSGIFTISKILEKMGIISKGLPSLFNIISGILTGIATSLGISVGWVVVIGVALGVAIALLVTYWDEISKFFSDIATWFYDKVIQPVSKFFTEIFEWIKPVYDAVFSIFKEIFKNISEIVVGVGKAIGSIISKVVEVFMKIIEINIALGKAFYNYVISPIIDFLSPIATWVFDHIIKPIYDKIKWLVTTAIGLFKTIGTTLVDFIGGSIKAVINGVLWGIENAINLFIKMLNGAIGIINKIPGVDITKVKELSIPRLKVGMDFVPNDYYPAYLDYGERVLTKEENRDYTAHIQGLDKNNKQTTINPTFIIQVGNEKLAKMVINDLQDMATTNGKPIVIGG